MFHWNNARGLTGEKYMLAARGYASQARFLQDLCLKLMKEQKIISYLRYRDCSLKTPLSSVAEWQGNLTWNGGYSQYRTHSHAAHTRQGNAASHRSALLWDDPAHPSEKNISLPTWSHQGKEGNSLSLDALEDAFLPATVGLTTEDSILNMMHSLLIQPMAGGVQACKGGSTVKMMLFTRQ